MFLAVTAKVIRRDQDFSLKPHGGAYGQRTRNTAYVGFKNTNGLLQYGFSFLRLSMFCELIARYMRLGSGPAIGANRTRYGSS